MHINTHIYYITPHSMSDMWARSQCKNKNWKAHIANANRSRELNSLRWFPYVLFCARFFFVYLCSSLGAERMLFAFKYPWMYVKWMINESISMNHRCRRSVVGLRHHRKKTMMMRWERDWEKKKTLWCKRLLNEWAWKVKKEMRTKEIRVINRFLVHLRNQHSETLSSSLFIIFFKDSSSFYLSLPQYHKNLFMHMYVR